MGLNLTEDKPAIPTTKESEALIAKDAAKAVAYLKRTSNLDVAPDLGLISYV